MIVIFDMDGVITSEQVYWQTAAMALDRMRGTTVALSLSLIARIKSLAINSNWDLAYVLFCCELMAWRQKYPGDDLTAVREYPYCFQFLAADDKERITEERDIEHVLETFSGRAGFELMKSVGEEASRRMEPREWDLSYQGVVFHQIHSLCQEIHDRRMKDSFFEKPTVDIYILRDMLEKMSGASGITLGIATGRTRAEASSALNQFGVSDMFLAERIVTYDETVMAQKELAGQGFIVGLAKPHPYSILRAAHPAVALSALLSQPLDHGSDIIYVGDGVSDMLAAKAAGARAIGVLTGVPDIDDLRKKRKTDLLAAGCDCVVSTVLHVPEAVAFLVHRQS